jgi:uncharacterized membrane protein
MKAMRHSREHRSLPLEAIDAPSPLRRAATFVGGIGLGAGLMYLLDPDRGSRRRAGLRDQARHAVHRERIVLDKGVRDLGHRMEGLAARLRQALVTEDVPDDILVERVRARMGRAVSHTGAIQVRADGGRITLSGPIFASEVDRLLRVTRRVRGVREVENLLEAHTTAEGVPGLQGSPRPRPKPMLLRDRWPPALRVVAMGVGLTATVYGLRRRGALGTAAGAAGAFVTLRAMLDLPAKRMLGIGAGRRAIDLQKSIIVHAPVEDVYRFWTHIENFPRFMEHVRDVHVSGDRGHWKVRGPGGITMSFDTEVTRLVPQEIFAWKTLPGSTIEHAGIARFEEVGDGATRLSIRMSYKPPAGAVGHALATLFRKDPKTALDEDLVRMKSLLEDGKTRAHGERVTLQELH